MQNVAFGSWRKLASSQKHGFIKQNLEAQTFFLILIRKVPNLLKSLSFSHSGRICREPGLQPGPVPSSQPLGLPSQCLAVQLCQNTLWGQPPATAARAIPGLGHDTRNITQPWAAAGFAPEILRGHCTSSLPKIHLLAALGGHSVSTWTCNETELAVGESRQGWCSSRCHSERRAPQCWDWEEPQKSPAHREISASKQKCKNSKSF